MTGGEVAEEKKEDLCALLLQVLQSARVDRQSGALAECLYDCCSRLCRGKKKKKKNSRCHQFKVMNRGEPNALEVGLGLGLGLGL